MFLSILIQPCLLAREKLQFQIGDNISIFAKKAIRRNEGKIFEAIGNTVILHKEDTLYGHAAKFDMEKKLFEINGNVRYITKDIALYGTYLNYFTETQKMFIDNARLFTAQFKIVAKNVEKIDEKTYLAHQAEFTTCKDCTESWTIYGEKVEVTLNDYVKVYHALMRVKGADFFYLPYIIFPIKKDRESGLLFPSFRSRGSEGLSFGQPVFWAINQSSDMTVTPTYWSERGFGGDFEYRKAFNNRSSYVFDSRGIKDRKFPNDDENRFLLDSTLNYQWGYDNMIYLKSLEMSDLAFPVDHPKFSQEKIIGSEFGTEAFLAFRNNFSEYGIEGTLQKSILNSDPNYYQDSFDLKDNTVNLLPSTFYSIAPTKILKSKSDFFNLMYLGGDLTVQRFRQNHFLELPGSYYRNVDRINVNPYLHLEMYNNGIFSLGTTYRPDFQYYDVKRSFDDSFQKYSSVLQTKLSFGVERTYGLAYKQLVNVESETKTESNDDEMIGHIEEFSKETAKSEKELTYSSYKHLQKFNLIHYYIPGEDEHGNDAFKRQINNINGRFDFYDSIRSKESEGGQVTRTNIPNLNTLEFQWNHNLIEKKVIHYDPDSSGRFLSDDFSYHRIMFLNFSQGVELQDDDQEHFDDRLTRFAMQVGTYFSKWFQVSLNEYYFYQDKRHVTSLSSHHDFDIVKWSNQYSFDGFSKNQVYDWLFDIAITDEIIFMTGQTRDLDENKNLQEVFGVHYIPTNDCWMLTLGYRKTNNDEFFTFDFQLNFGNPNFYQTMRRIF